MREIELGKMFGENPQPNIINFIGCVTTQRKEIHFFDGSCFFLCVLFLLYISADSQKFTSVSNETLDRECIFRGYT